MSFLVMYLKIYFPNDLTSIKYSATARYLLLSFLNFPSVYCLQTRWKNSHHFCIRVLLETWLKSHKFYFILCYNVLRVLIFLMHWSAVCVKIISSDISDRYGANKYMIFIKILIQWYFNSTNGIQESVLDHRTFGTAIWHRKINPLIIFAFNSLILPEILNSVRSFLCSN